MKVVEHLSNLLVSFEECRILSFDGCRLVAIGDFDLTYHHHFEAEFLEVSYIQCPIDFNAQSFRLATAPEREAGGLANYMDRNNYLFCFESDEYRFFISAQSLSVREGLVLHYKQDQWGCQQRHKRRFMLRPSTAI